MKQLIVIAKDNNGDDWWESLSYNEQVDYLEEHKDSKRKITKSENDSDNSTDSKNKLLINVPGKKEPPKYNRSTEDQAVFDKAKSEGVAIPPAWSKVNYYGTNGNEKGVIAEGTDSKGRKQRLENSAYRDGKIKEKHAKIRETLSPKMPKIIKSLKAKAAEGNSEEAKVLYLITQTAFRIGGKGDGKSEKVFGASTLQGRHVTVEGDTVIFDFIGKGGVHQHHAIKDPIIAKMVSGKAADENLFNTNEDKVRDLWKKYGGDKVHDIRSHIATEEAKKVINKIGQVSNAKEYKALLKAASEAAAHKLGNKPAESLKTYIDNSVFDNVNINESTKETSSADITWEEFVKIRDKLDNTYDKARMELDRIVGNSRLSNGLTPDHIKQSNEYKNAKRITDIAYNNVRNFNGKYVKHFSKEIKQEIHDKRMKKLGK